MFRCQIWKRWKENQLLVICRCLDLIIKSDIFEFISEKIVIETKGECPFWRSTIEKRRKKEKEKEMFPEGLTSNLARGWVM